MNKTLHTKWGTAKVSEGYYKITSGKEGNWGKRLHRLIWEDFYGCEVPKGYVIHHRDHNSLNNCILNLQLMRREDHIILHRTGKTHSEETKRKISETKKGKFTAENGNYGWHLSEETKNKMSESKNTSGYFRVSKNKCKNCKQGFIWVYRYYVDGKTKVISSTNIEKLESKVKAKGLKWKKLKGDE